MMSDDDYDGQIIFGDLVGLKLPDIRLTGEENPRKNLTQKTCPDRELNPGPLRDKRACYHVFHSGGLSFSNISVTSPTSQLILQPFRRFIYVTAHSPTLPLLHLCHSSFSNHSFASPTSQALHLIHLASRPCFSTEIERV